MFVNFIIRADLYGVILIMKIFCFNFLNCSPFCIIHLFSYNYFPPLRLDGESHCVTSVYYPFACVPLLCFCCCCFGFGIWTTQLVIHPVELLVQVFNGRKPTKAQLKPTKAQLFIEINYFTYYLLHRIL